MAWRDRFDATASFRGVEFLIQGHERPFGRDVYVHGYPGRDTSYPEDLGLAWPDFRIEALIVGPDYDVQRDKLIAACETPGPGTLVHPYRGTLQVQARISSLTESSKEGGLARFSLAFALYSPPISPEARVDTLGAVDQAVEDSIAAAAADFVRVFSVDSFPAFVTEKAVEAVDLLTTELESRITSVVGYPFQVQTALASLNGLADAADLARDPEALADQITARIRDASGMGNVNEGIRFARRLGSWTSSSASAQPATASRLASVRNETALQALVRRTAVVESARLSASLVGEDGAIQSRNELTALRSRLRADLAVQIDAAGDAYDDAAYAALRALQAAVLRDLDARATQLPIVRVVEVGGTVPSLVAAQRYYGDVEREPELVARNAIRHPGFIPGGTSLEILSSAQ